MDKHAFVAPTPLSRLFTARLPQTSPQRRTTRAVLDTPASNPYLISVCASTARDFLTRRAVHNVLYYYSELRDSATKRWLLNFENFAQLEQQDMFHDGNAYLTRMLQARPVHGTIEQRHPRAYFSRKYPFTIHPARVARSVLASRAQLAAEWAVDLRCVEAGNVEIQRMSFERLIEKDEKVLLSRRNIVFDAEAYGDQSPMRGKNFSKLLVLLTQHAIMRLIAFLRDTSNHEYMWLTNFVARYGPLHDGDHFITELLSQPPEQRTNPAKIIDPRALAVEVMDLRSTIASEWMSLMHRIPDEQLALTRALLERSADIDVSKRLDDTM